MWVRNRDPPSAAVIKSRPNRPAFDDLEESVLSNCDTEVEGEEGPAWVEGGEVVGEVMLQHRSLVLRLTVCWAATQGNEPYG